MKNNTFYRLATGPPPGKGWTPGEMLDPLESWKMIVFFEITIYIGPICKIR